MEKKAGVSRKEKGTVKWFSNRRGFGFIRWLEDREAFVHYTDIRAYGYRALREGQEVEFDAVQGAKGWRAVNVKVLPA